VKLPAYPRYKPSGVERLGDVPEHWEVKRSDGIVSADRSQLSPEAFADRDVFHYSIPVVQETGTGQVENGESIASAKQVIKKPVVLVSKLNPRKATICLAKPQGILTLGSTEFVALNADKCELAFLEYLTRSELFRQGLDSKVQSVTRSHQRANPADIYRFWNAWPTREDQQAIAAFLDRETGRLDQLVAKKRELIERLKEKRTALISRTVTHGLPPAAARAAGLPENPPLKPSGLEWLGDIPKHWRVMALKWRSRCRSGDGIFTEDVTPEPTPERSIPVIGGNGVMGYCDSSNCDHPVLVIGRVGALCGNVHLIAPPAWITDNALVMPTDSATFSQKYLAAVLRTRNLNDLADKTAQPLITGTRVRAERVPVPPHPEQAAIAAYLDMETAKLDALVAKVEEAVERLQEYRTALITAAVTGKIDVRGSVDVRPGKKVTSASP
jgi:type I restriction enzyme S subunit